VGTVRRNTVTAAVREQEPPVDSSIAITRAYLRMSSRYWLALGTRRASAGYRSDVCFETQSRAGDTAAGARAKKQEKRTMTVPDRRQPSLLLRCRVVEGERNSLDRGRAPAASGARVQDLPTTPNLPTSMSIHRPMPWFSASTKSLLPLSASRLSCGVRDVPPTRKSQHFSEDDKQQHTNYQNRHTRWFRDPDRLGRRIPRAAGASRSVPSKRSIAGRLDSWRKERIAGGSRIV
jgi:hypothetical protein